MPRRRKHGKRREGELTLEQQYFLWTGDDLVHCFPFGNPPNMAWAQAVWRDHHDEVMEGFGSPTPRLPVPWAEAKFGKIPSLAHKTGHKTGETGI